ncbi:MAG: hypothetical protein PHY92_00565 [Alphaproteobacteria bacterium]|nr:hypothetical protein [Alphaproteobacteria bacterium]
MKPPHVLFFACLASAALLPLAAAHAGATGPADIPVSSASVHVPLSNLYAITLIDPASMSQETWRPWPWWSNDNDKVDLTAPQPNAVQNIAPLPQTPQPMATDYAGQQDVMPPMQRQPALDVSPAPLSNAQAAAPQPPTFRDRASVYVNDMFVNPDDKSQQDPNMPRTTAVAGYQPDSQPAQSIYAPAVPLDTSKGKPTFRKRMENWFDNLFAMPGDNTAGRSDLPRTAAQTNRPRTFH